MHWQWSDSEDDALQGLPWLSQLVYLRAIRRYMDFKTGIVGIKRGISYQSIRETLYVEPIPGSHEAPNGDVSMSAVRNAISRLEKQGLIERRSTDRRLVFFLPLAAPDQSVQNRSDRGATEERQTSSDRPLSSNDAASEDRSDKGATEQTGGRSDSPQDTEYQKKESTTYSVDFAEAKCDGSPVSSIFEYWQSVMSKPRCKLDAKRKRAIAARLKDGYSVDDIKQAIDGCRQSDWHMGRNDRQQPFNDIELICRDAAKVDGFRERATGKRQAGSFLDDDDVIEGQCRRVSNG